MILHTGVKTIRNTSVFVALIIFIKFHYANLINRNVMSKGFQRRGKKIVKLLLNVVLKERMGRERNKKNGIKYKMIVLTPKDLFMSDNRQRAKMRCRICIPLPKEVVTSAVMKGGGR